MTSAEVWPLFVVVLGVFLTAGLASLGWATRRILNRIDAIGEKVDGLTGRLFVVETKQTDAADAAAKDGNVTRRAALQVGVRRDNMESPLGAQVRRGRVS